MSLSLKTLRELFPKDEPAFKPPFRVETDKDGEVHIYDADDDALLTFCTHTQLPIDDDRALAAEVSYWEVEAGRIVTALNAAYPPPLQKLVARNAFEMAAKLIDDHAIQDTSAGKVLVPRQDGNRDGLHYAIAIRALASEGGQGYFQITPASSPSGSLGREPEPLVASNTSTCERCQGNGEIVTDWERYRHPREGDKGDEAVAECPDCSGKGAAEEGIEYWKIRALTAEGALAIQGDARWSAKPVAWRFRHVPYVGWTYSGTKHPRSDLEQEPLYAASSPVSRTNENSCEHMEVEVGNASSFDTPPPVSRKIHAQRTRIYVVRSWSSIRICFCDSRYPRVRLISRPLRRRVHPMGDLLKRLKQRFCRHVWEPVRNRHWVHHVCALCGSAGPTHFSPLMKSEADCPGFDDPEERCPRDPKDCVCWDAPRPSPPSIIEAAEANIRADYRAGKISKEQFQKELLIVARARHQALTDTPPASTEADHA